MNLEISTRSSSPTADGSHQWLVATSSVLWLLVAAATVYGGLGDDDEWKAAYAVFVPAPAMAASAIAFTVVRWGRPATNALIGPVGVVVLVVAVAGIDRSRTPLFAPAVAPLAGPGAFFVGGAVGIGDGNSYGDHPLAGDARVALSSLLTAAAVWLTVRSSGERSDR